MCIRDRRDVALQHCRELLTGDGVIGTQVVLTVTGHNAGFKAERSAITVKLGDFGVIGRFLNSHACIGCSQFRINELCTVVKMCIRDRYNAFAGQENWVKP